MKRWFIGICIAVLLLMTGCEASSAAGNTTTTTTTGSTTLSTTVTTTTTTEATTTTTTTTGASTTTPDTDGTTTTVDPATTVPTAPPGPPKLIALTFDDGPGKYTERLLDILEELDVKATFFIKAPNAEIYESTVKRMVNNGHEIGSHSMTHAHLPSVSAAQLEKEINDSVEMISKVAGRPITLFRAPYGAVNDKVKKQAADAGVRLIGWSVDTRDWEYSDVDVHYARAQILYHTFTVRSSIKEGGIVLMHDIHENSVESVQLLVHYLRQNGYDFVTVQDLMDEHANGGEAGKVYNSFTP